MFDVTTKPRPSLPPDLVMLWLTMPIRSPARVNMGPDGGIPDFATHYHLADKRLFLNHTERLIPVEALAAFASAGRKPMWGAAMWHRQAEWTRRGHGYAAASLVGEEAT